MLITFFQWNNFGYADKAKEVKRVNTPVASIDHERNAVRAEKRRRNLAWSEHTTKNEERDKRREKKMRKKKWLQTQAIKPPHSEDEGLGKGVHNEDDNKLDEDWADLAREERMAKKVKKGDISQKTFDAEFGSL
jgi:ATP-dependent RNA helicase DDX55/SPB4